MTVGRAALWIRDDSFIPELLNDSGPSFEGALLLCDGGAVLICCLGTPRGNPHFLINSDQFSIQSVSLRLQYESRSPVRWGFCNHRPAKSSIGALRLRYSNIGFGRMPVRYVIDKEKRLVISTGWDRVTLAEVLAHQEQLLKDPDFNPEFNQLLDGTRVTDYALSSVEVNMIANRKLFSPTSRRALLVRSALLYGMGRMFQSYYEMSKAASPMWLFHDRESALKWLGVDSLPQQEGRI